MYLKNLTVFGFKSFADRTSLDFQKGITAIVGPNGCGKSNVADAIRWVLGEQSAKALRGGGMQDVIFAGTSRRKMLGTAEVSITIGDIDQENLHAAGVPLDYNEVTLTRRIFRDGGSEYYINKTPCRLKDIQRLFMGTGVGRTSYSIMAQGNITQLLSSRPEDRRMVFEEAAGITKFKAQKKEALRKLDHTETNLIRVEDLIREVKRQIGSLQRQAGKARRYKKYMDQLQQMDTQLARHDFDQLHSEINAHQVELENLRRDVDTRSAMVIDSENEIGKLRGQLGETEQKINQQQQKALEVRANIERFDSRVQFNEERIKELESQNEKALSDIAQAEERRDNTKKELEELIEKLSQTENTLEIKTARVQKEQESVSSVEGKVRELQGELNQAHSQSFVAAQDLSKARNEVNALELQAQGNLVRQEKLSSEKVQLEEERQRLETRLKEFNIDVENRRKEIVTKREFVEQRQARLRELQSELSAASQTVDQLTTKQAELKSRLNVLNQLHESREGFSQGAQAALKHKDLVVGTLADRINVPTDYVKATELALGSRLQIVLTKNPDAATSIFESLNKNKKGRASIAALELLTGSPAPASTVEPPSQAGLVLALDVIRTDEETTPLLERLLADTWIADSIEIATEAWKATAGALDFVTVDGAVLDKSGVFTSGYSNGSGKGPSSILGRKNQIKTIEKDLKGLENDVEKASKAKGALQGEQTEVQASLQTAQTELRKQEVEIATAEGEFKALETSNRTLGQKIETVVYEIQSLAEQDREGKARRDGINERIGELEQRANSLQERVEQLNEELEQVRQNRDSANAVLTEAKVEKAGEEQFYQSLKSSRVPLENRINELTQLVAQRKSEMESFNQRVEQARQEIAESGKTIETLKVEQEEVNEHCKTTEELRKTQEEAIKGKENEIRETRDQLEQARQRRSQLDVILAEKNMTSKNLVERIEQKYQIDLNEVTSECIVITTTDEGQPTVETITPEEMKQNGLSTDWDQIKDQVQTLQGKIDAMGAVNLVAIEEYEETEQRFEFLSNQFDELTNAKAQLLEVITTINKQTKEMFTTTFEKIRENFKEMFTEIFNGGTADLVLSDTEDVLESGIEIVARPPGKRLQNITLLSGGEQTMTAVALLFAIYQVKPSPFCVLDELDAPLDESNINRFVRILQRFVDKSQFIIITHNKRTISMASTLYGVTMQEQGVSRIVSVKFQDDSKRPDDLTVGRTDRPLVPPDQGDKPKTAKNDGKGPDEEIVMVK